LGELHFKPTHRQAPPPRPDFANTVHYNTSINP
jgi:hypothetical protein